MDPSEIEDFDPVEVERAEAFAQMLSYFEDEGLMRIEGDRLFHHTHQEEAVNSSHTPSELVQMALNAVEGHVNLGVCVGCAINIVAADKGVDYDKLETLYIDAQVAKLDNEDLPDGSLPMDEGSLD